MRWANFEYQYMSPGRGVVPSRGDYPRTRDTVTEESARELDNFARRKKAQQYNKSNFLDAYNVPMDVNPRALPDEAYNTRYSFNSPSAVDGLEFPAVKQGPAQYQNVKHQQTAQQEKLARDLADVINDYKADPMGNKIKASVAAQNQALENRFASIRSSGASVAPVARKPLGWKGYALGGAGLAAVGGLGLLAGIASRSPEEAQYSKLLNLVYFNG